MDSTTITIKVGRLLPGAQEVGEGANRPLRGIAATSEGEIAVIAKKLDSRKMAVEAVCAALGRSAGLPIPEPILLLDQDNSWSFGSIDGGHPNLAQFISTNDHSVIDELVNWPSLLEAACFDELIANADRNDGNILYDGHEFTLIDHELCIPQGMRPDDYSDDYYNNRFLELVVDSCCDELSTERAARRALGWAEQKSKPAVSESERQTAGRIDYHAQDQLISFLRQRIITFGATLYEKIKPTAQGRLNL